MDTNSIDGVVAVNQTRSWEDGIFRDKKYYYTCNQLATKHKHSQEHLT